MKQRTAIVVGGGLAGLTAACELAGAGVKVKLIEKRPFLGGRAYSYTDKRTGMEVDNGQHVFLGCCTEYIGFLKRLGVWDGVKLQKRLRLRVIDKVWGESLFLDSNLPVPFHVLPSLLKFRSLTGKERFLAARAFAVVRGIDIARHPELDEVTFEQWLVQHDQSPNAIRSLWDLFTRPALNGDAAEVSAAAALMVFQAAFLKARNGANIGWARMGLSRLLGQAAQRYIEERGGEVLLGQGIDSIRVEDGLAAGVVAGGGEWGADNYVLAVTSRDLASLLPATLKTDPYFARVTRIEASPIVNVHLWYDRPVWRGGFAAFLNSPLQWVFNKSRLWRENLSSSHLEGVASASGITSTFPPLTGNGPSLDRLRKNESDVSAIAYPAAKGDTREVPQYLDISLSGANEYLAMPSREIIETFTKEIAVFFPEARRTQVSRALVIKQPDATFLSKPGVARLRPPQRTPLGNVFLAGDWTATGWPATMESAVRSGLQAAREIIGRDGYLQGKEALAVS